MKINITIALLLLSTIATAETFVSAHTAHKTASDYYVARKEETKKTFFNRIAEAISNTADIGKYKIIIEIEDNELEFVVAAISSLNESDYQVARIRKNALYIHW